MQNSQSITLLDIFERCMPGSSQAVTAKQVSKRSPYDMSELRSVFQKMLREPNVLPNGIPEYHYFVDEYLFKLQNNIGRLLLYITEDCARCHPDVLERVIVLLDNAKQPVDHSAAYLSVACLDRLKPLQPIQIATSTWKGVVHSGEE